MRVERVLRVMKLILLTVSAMLATSPLKRLAHIVDYAIQYPHLDRNCFDDMRIEKVAIGDVQKALRSVLGKLLLLFAA